MQHEIEPFFFNSTWIFFDDDALADMRFWEMSMERKRAEDANAAFQGVPGTTQVAEAQGELKFCNYW